MSLAPLNLRAHFTIISHIVPVFSSSEVISIEPQNEDHTQANEKVSNDLSNLRLKKFVQKVFDKRTSRNELRHH